MSKQEDLLKRLPSSKMSDEELKKIRERVAIQDPEHLKRWVLGRRPYLIFMGKDLMDALEPLFPAGAHHLQDLINCYRAHRFSQPTGETKVDTVSGEEVLLFKDDSLTEVELDRMIRWSISQMNQRFRDPETEWTPGDVAL